MTDQTREQLAKAYGTNPPKRVLFSDDDLIRAADQNQPLTPTQRIAAGYAATEKETDQ